MIKFHGYISVPDAVAQYADTIKLENYKTNTPTKFQIRSLHDDLLMNDLAKVIGKPVDSLDFVYFSVCKGAEPHTDKLDPSKFTDTTYVIPVVVPNGKSVLFAEDDQMVVTLGGIYEFDHSKTHSMTLEDTESGCVVIMVAEKRYW